MPKQSPEWIEQLVERVELAFAELEQAYRTTNGTVRDRGARPVPVEAGKRVRLATGGGTLSGFALRETGGAAALVNLRDGADASADVVMPISFAAGESVRDWFGPNGISLYYGLFMEVVSGAVEGSVFLGGVE